MAARNTTWYTSFLFRLMVLGNVDGPAQIFRLEILKLRNEQEESSKEIDYFKKKLHDAERTIHDLKDSIARCISRI